jgi:hypothetical protein
MSLGECVRNNELKQGGSKEESFTNKLESYGK